MLDKHGKPVPLTKRLDIPPLWLAGTLIAQSLIAWAFPVFALPSGASALGLPLIVVGFALIIWSAVHFKRAQTPIHPRRKPTSLITSGPFAFSRNPIYLGMALIALGFALRLGAYTPLLLVPAFMLIIQKRFIDGEELHIAKSMGAEWAGYTAKTRRWL